MRKQIFTEVLLIITVILALSQSRPIGFTQVAKVTSWWPQENIAKSIGVPGYSNTDYNYFSLGTWTCGSGLGSMANVFAKPIGTFGGNFLGTTDDTLRKALKNKYQTAGSKVLLSAFGNVEQPIRYGKSAQECAQKLATDVKNFDFDGVQLDFQDDYTLQQGKAESWLIDFTRKLRELLPTLKIVHTVKAKYFGSGYPSGGYVKINKDIGNSIDFYNIKYYGDTLPYDSYNELFVKSEAPNTGTSVKEIGASGIPFAKIVVGKTAKTTEVGYVDPATLGSWAVSAKNQVGWSTGFWLGEFHHDAEGAGIKNALKLLEFADDGTAPAPDSNVQPEPTPAPTPSDNTYVAPAPSPAPAPTPSDNTYVAPAPAPAPAPLPEPENNTFVAPSPSGGGAYKLPFPVYFAYVDGVTVWWGKEFLAGLGVPGYASTNPYNYFALAFWLTTGPVDVALVWAKAETYFSWMGDNTTKIQQQLKKAYNDAGKRLMVSAFGATQFPTTEGKEAVKTANDFADFVLANNLDGVDIDWQDNGAMQAGTGEDWLIKFQTTLRSRLPNHIITHAPQAPYFKQEHYKNGAYVTVNNKVGKTIDFYTVQYYNQGDTTYDSYDGLFMKAGGWFSGTSVQEMIDRGVPARKIVIGKPATLSDVMNTGYMSAQKFGQYIGQFKQQKGVEPQVMFWQYLNDQDGTICRTVLEAAGVDWKNYRFVDPSYMMGGGNNIAQNDSTAIIPASNPLPVQNDTTTITPLPVQNDTSITPLPLPSASSYQVPFPIYFGYANGMASWWGDGMLAGLGVPGYTPELPYNYMALSFWLTSGTADLVYLWANAATAMSFVGGDTPTIQKKLKKYYNDKGMKVIISAFGATEFPTSAGKDPIVTANQLGTFIKNNNVDGVDIDWEDNGAMQAGTGEAWLIKFQTQLRANLPNHIITHAPQAPYFKSEYYRNGAYVTVNNKVGSTIDFYTVQFYNQGDTQYNTYQQLFVKATGTFSGTSVKEIIARGVPAKKMVVGKPATMADVMNTGYISPSSFGSWCGQFKREAGWTPSVMFWQFKNDPKGDIVKSVLTSAGVDYRNTGFMDGSNYVAPAPTNTTNNTSNYTAPTNNTTTNTTNNTSNYTAPAPAPAPAPSGTVTPATGASHVLSMFYCGYSGNFCGQSNTDDVNAKASIVILSFANTNYDGSITVDEANHPATLVSKWKAAGKQVILSVGGQNGHWDVVFKSNTTINTFVTSVNNYLVRLGLDGVDLDIESYAAPPRIVADLIIALKKKIGTKLVIVSPENVAIYQGTAVPSADVGGQPFNYFVPIVKLADAYIDFYQPQAYNNWYGGLTGGSLAYFKEVYLNWRNLQGTVAWSSPIPNFQGVSSNKLLIGLLASTSAGGANYYAPSTVITAFKSWLKQNNYPLKGFMMWDSNWDKLNLFSISNACTTTAY